MTNLATTWPARDGELTLLWSQGLTTVAIAARMGLTKNSVIGRAHRLDLPGRTNPIAAKGRHILTALRAVPGASTSAPAGSAEAVNRARKSLMAKHEAKQPPIQRLATKPVVRGGTCLWTEGDRGAWVLCRDPVAQGCFCAAHAMRGYHRDAA